MTKETVGRMPLAFVRLPKTGCETESQSFPAGFGRSDHITKRTSPTMMTDATSSLDLARIRFINQQRHLPNLYRLSVEQRLA